MSKSITRPLFCDPKILSSFGHDVSRLLNYLHIEALTCKAGSTKNQRKVNLNHVLSKALADSAIVHVFSIKPIAVAVAQSLFLMSFVSVSFASGGYNLDLDLPSTTSRGAVIFKNFNDTVDGTQGQTLYYSSGSNDNSLIVTFDQAYPIFQAWNAPYDNQFYIAGGIRTLPQVGRIRN